MKEKNGRRERERKGQRKMKEKGIIEKEKKERKISAHSATERRGKGKKDGEREEK